MILQHLLSFALTTSFFRLEHCVYKMILLGKSLQYLFVFRRNTTFLVFVSDLRCAPKCTHCIYLYFYIGAF